MNLEIDYLWSHKCPKKWNQYTLIALVITIIVLLILAGVTIATLTGDNGLLQKATSAKQENEDSKELELIKLAVSAAQVAGEGTITAENLNNELRSIFNDNNIKVDERPGGWITKRTKIYTIYEDGNIKNGNLLPLLPKEYQQLEYIKTLGAQYINTKYYPDKDTGAKYKVCVLEYKDYGPHLLSSKYYYFPFYRLLGNRQLVAKRGNDELNISKLNFSDEDIFEYEAFNNNNIIVNGNIVGQLSSVGAKDTVPLYIGTYGGNPNYADFVSQAIFYYCIIYNKDKEVRNFVPCKSITTVTNADGKSVSADTKDLYDLVEGKFYTNANTAENAEDFIAGPEV